MKRIVVLSDLHCGHRVGLTPPEWQFPSTGSGSDRDKFGELQKVLWDWYYEHIEKLKPIDCVVMNGDAIDGKGDKSGGTELITSDRLEQVRMAATALRITEAKQFKIVFGTPYHTGSQEDMEEALAREIGADWSGLRLSLEVHGIKFDFRHHLSSSSLPHGRHGPSAKSAIWGLLQSLQEGSDPARIFVRSHVHYFQYAGNSMYLTMTTPAMSGSGSKFGERVMDGTTDCGFVFFDVEERGYWKWDYQLFRTKSPAGEVVQSL